MLQFNLTTLITPFAKKKKITHTLDFFPNCLLPWKQKIILVRKCYNVSAIVQSVAVEIVEKLHPMT